jgi:hypothetical protein
VTPLRPRRRLFPHFSVSHVFRFNPRHHSGLSDHWSHLAEIHAAPPVTTSAKQEFATDDNTGQHH